MSCVLCTIFVWRIQVMDQLIVTEEGEEAPRLDVRCSVWCSRKVCSSYFCMTPKNNQKHQSTRSSEIIKENVIKMNKQKLWRRLKRWCLVMMFLGLRIQIFPPTASSAQRIGRACRRHWVASCSSLDALILLAARRKISPFCGFLCLFWSFFFFGRNVFDVVWGFWCIAQFVDAIGWRVPARGVIPEVKLNEIGTHPLGALSGVSEMEKQWRWWWGHKYCNLAFMVWWICMKGNCQTIYQSLSQT